MSASSSYTARDITVLDGLEHVRLRPGMYIGGTGPQGLHHLLWEIVDNAVDEVINGFASTIEVTLHADGTSVTVSDNGRGIPVDTHPDENRSALEIILTTLYSGAKFNQNNYITAGGLHGVGSSVVNALSESFTATIKRHGGVWRQDYRRGVPQGPVARVSDDARGSGTAITFRPDEEIFDSVRFNAELIAKRLEIKAYLNRGMRLVFRDEASNSYHVFKHDGGLGDYIQHLVEEMDADVIHTPAFTLRTDDLPRIELAIQWTESTRVHLQTFVNGIPTPHGGTHEQGLRDGVVKAIRQYVKTYDLLPRGLTLTTDDIREGLCGALSLFISEPQFQGQTKDKLNNPEVRSVVAALVSVELEQHLHKNTTVGDAIVARMLQAARARKASRAAAKRASVTRRTSKRLNLPGKLADCASSDPELCELFIVEGDSAGGSAKQGRDRTTQAILPLRGKVLNTEQATLSRVLSNKELQNIVSALGCGLGDDFDLEGLRYHKVILLMDADSDGHHIATLLLTFFFRHMPKLIQNGHVFLAQPPLFRVDHGQKTWWARDDAQLKSILARIRRKRSNAKPIIQRFKGLGEMMPQTLRETTLDPERRRLLQVTVPDGSRIVTDQIISDLMGRSTSARFGFIMEHAANTHAAELDV